MPGTSPGATTLGSQVFEPGHQTRTPLNRSVGHSRGGEDAPSNRRRLDPLASAESVDPPSRLTVSRQEPVTSFASWTRGRRGVRLIAELGGGGCRIVA